MKKILYINVTYKIASTGRIINDIVSSPDIGDIEYRVLFQEGNNGDGIGIQFENKFENILRRGIHKFFGNVDFVTVTQTKRLISEIKKFNPDLIHIHTIHHQCTNYLMLFDFLKEYGKPVIFTIHDCWAYTGGCYHYTEVGCNGFVKECKECPKQKTELDCKPEKTSYFLQKKRDFYSSDIPLYFTGVSEWICGEARKSIPENKSIKCIRNGVDINYFDNFRDLQEVKKLSKKLHNGRKYLVLGVASYWREQKGLSGFRKLAEYLGDDYQVLLVGGNLSSESGIENLKYYGLTNNVQELAYIYNSADILVNMSIEESFGLVTAEAAACGTPTVAYDSTANSEVISLSGGSLIPVGEENLMFETIKKICSDGKKNRDIAEIRHLLSKERMVKEYLDIYNTVLSDSKKNNERG